jgi:predicted metal-dependent peptidase
VTRAADRVLAARVLARERWPYVSHLLFSLRLVPVTDGSLDTLAVDAGWRLYFNEEYVLGLSVAHLATDLQHEAMHCMLNHHERFTALKDSEPDHRLFNIAGDCGINHIIEESGFEFSETDPPVRYKDFPKINETMTTERAYFILKDEKNKQPPSSGSEKKPAPDRDCGSISGGDARDYEIAPEDESAPAASEEVKAVVRSKVAADVETAAKSGNPVAGGLIRWAEDFRNPKVNWRQQLAVRIRVALANKSGRRDYSMMRPSRREQGLTKADTQIRLPAMRQPGDPKTTVIVDTSGSISHELLKTLLAEVMGITKAVGSAHGVVVIPCDSVAYPATKVRKANDVQKLQLPGGGGTDMREGIAAALAIKPRPDAIVIVTDGYTPWPSVKPVGCDSFIALLTTSARSAKVPSWAKTVVIDSDS